jgi:hypothetical protein
MTFSFLVLSDRQELSLSASFCDVSVSNTDSWGILATLVTLLVCRLPMKCHSMSGHCKHTAGLQI